MLSKRTIATSVVLAATACVVALGVTQPVLAQTSVALIDIGKVFKSHPVFGQQLQSLKTEAEQFKAETQQLQRDLQVEAQGLQGLEPSSAEFKAEETRLAQKSAAKEVEQRGVMRELMKREARLHFDTYNEVKKVIASHCERAGIRMVLRYNSVAMDEDDPSVIMQKVNGSVVFHTNQKDITQDIVTQIVQLKAASRDTGVNRR